MKRYSISVVIPVYNSQAYICETLDSVTRQSRPPEQIVIVNDGSTDQTMERISSWAQRNTQTLTIVQQTNQGVSAARNRGIEHAQTDLIAFLDADDLFLPNHLEQLERGFENHNIVVCFGDALHFDDKGIVKPSSLAGTLIERIGFKKQNDELRLMNESAYLSLLNGNYIALSSALVSKKALERVGLFDTTIRRAEDRDLFLRLSRIGPFAYYAHVVAHKRRHDANLTHARHSISAQHYALIVLRKMLNRVEELGLSEIEIQHTRTAKDNHIQTMLYSASRQGLQVYLKTCRFLISQEEVWPVCSPRHLLRALVHRRQDRLAPSTQHLFNG